MAGFGDGYNEARKKRPGFSDGSRQAQGRTPLNSLGYQAGNVANQVTPGKYDPAATMARAEARADYHGKNISRLAGAIRRAPEAMGGNLKSPRVRSSASNKLYPDNDLSVVSRTTGENAPSPRVSSRNTKQNSGKSGKLDGGYVPGKYTWSNADFNGNDFSTRGKSALQSRSEMVANRQPAVNQNQRVGNMDVQFDPSVSQEARNRFMQDPVRPTAGIARFQARQRAQMAPAPMAAPQPPEEPDYYTREDKHIGGWQTRAKLNDQMAENYRAKLNAFYGMQGKKMDNMTERERNAISAMDTIGQNKYRASQVAQGNQQIEAGQFELDRKQQIAELQDELFSGEISPEREKQITRQLFTLQGKEPKQDSYSPVSRKVYNGFGAVSGEEPGVFDPRTGQYQWEQQSDYPPAPPEAGQRRPGEIYRAPNGMLVLWDGKGFKKYGEGSE